MHGFLLDMFKVIAAATISSCLGPLLPQQLRPAVQLSRTQAARWQDLRTQIQIPFDPDNAEHMVYMILSVLLW